MTEELKDVYDGVAIGDIHTGAFEASIWYKEMVGSFIEPVAQLPSIDFIIICGDLFDNRLSMNTDHTKYLVMFLNKVVNICKDKKCKLRILKGTESHDNNQLQFLEALFHDSEIDVRIIHTVEDEYLFPNYHILYVPEEYMDDQDAYYKDYFDKTYDGIFGHGMIQEAMMVAAKQESEATMSKAPVFKVDDLINISKGPIFFGHVHNKIVLKKKFHYTNSPSRWSFGEEEDKGYYIFWYKPITGEFETKYMVNELARKFETLEVDCKLYESAEQQVKYLVSLVDTLAEDREYLRLEVNIPEEYPNSTLLVNLINSVFSKYKKFKLKINNNGKLVKNKEVEEKVNLLLERYGFIFDNKLSVEDKLCLYIKVKYQVNIPIEKMVEYLHGKL